MIDKSACDKGFICKISNFKCEYDKSCVVGEYLDYEYCKCRKSLVDKFVEDCIENIDEAKIAKTTLSEHKNVCKCSCTIIFTINFGIGTYFVYYKCMNRNKEAGARYDCVYQTTDY